MQSVITTQEVTRKLDLLDPPQKQTVYEFITFLLRRRPGQKTSEDKHLLLQTSVWSEEDVQRVYDAQQEVRKWQIPTLS